MNISGWAGSRYRSGGLTPQFAYSQLNGGVPVCDHAAPPEGFHYEQKPGTTGSCNLVLKPNAATTGSGNNNGSGTGSNTGTGTGTGTTVTGGGTSTPAAGTGLALSPELTKALWIAAAIWVASKVFKG